MCRRHAVEDARLSRSSRSMSFPRPDVRSRSPPACPEGGRGNSGEHTSVPKQPPSANTAAMLETFDMYNWGGDIKSAPEPCVHLIEGELHAASPDSSGFMSSLAGMASSAITR